MNLRPAVSLSVSARPNSADELILQKEHSASFIPAMSKFTAAIPYAEDNGRFAPLIALDCRGLEFTSFHFRGKWKCEGEDSETQFDIDWSAVDEEGRWDDYDEKAELPVSISELKSKIERM